MRTLIPSTRFTGRVIFRTPTVAASSATAPMCRRTTPQKAKATLLAGLKSGWAVNPVMVRPWHTWRLQRQANWVRPIQVSTSNPSQSSRGHFREATLLQCLQAIKIILISTLAAVVIHDAQYWETQNRCPRFMISIVWPCSTRGSTLPMAR